MGVNKVQLSDGTVLMSVEDSANVSENTMLTGTEAYDENGNKVAGSLVLADITLTETDVGVVIRATESDGTRVQALIAKGAAGKSAYDIAVDGGYEGTEDDFKKKLAEEYPDLLDGGISISAGADLDTYKTVGKYYANNNATAADLINCPTTQNFVMFVFVRTTSEYVTQLIIDLVGKIYARSLSSSGWRGWSNPALKTDIPVLTEYTATLSASGWSSSAPYTQAVTVDGILSTDNPVADVVLSSTDSTAISELEGWGCVSEITTANGSITAKCLEEKPAVALTVRMQVWR